MYFSIIIIVGTNHVFYFIDYLSETDGISTQQYYREMGATCDCSVRLVEGTNPEPEAASMVIGDSWFGYIKLEAEVSKKRNGRHILSEKNHGLYLKQFISDALSDTPGGTQIVLTGNHPNGPELVATGYR